MTPLQLERLTDHGHLVRILHGVYRVAGAPDSPLDPIRGAWLALEPDRTAANRLDDPVPFGVVSHRSAAVLQELGDLDADVHRFTVARRRRSRSSDVAFTVAELGVAEWHRVDGLPVTRPLRTVTDLAVAGTDGGHLASVVRDAILTGDTTLDEIAEALRPYAHNYGARPGDGAGVVKTFINTVGVPASAVALAQPTTEPDLELTPEMSKAIRKTVLEVLIAGGFDQVLRDAVSASLPAGFLTELVAELQPIIAADLSFTLEQVQVALQNSLDGGTARTHLQESR